MILDRSQGIVPNGKKYHEKDQVRKKTLFATGLKEWFVCIAHVSYLLPSNMRHMLGVVNVSR